MTPNQEDAITRAIAGLNDWWDLYLSGTGDEFENIEDVDKRRAIARELAGQVGDAAMMIYEADAPEGVERATYEGDLIAQFANVVASRMFDVLTLTEQDCRDI